MKFKSTLLCLSLGAFLLFGCTENSEENIGEEQTEQAIYRVPSNYNGIIHTWNSNVGKNDDAIVRLSTGGAGKVMRERDDASLFQSSGNNVILATVDAGDDIIVYAKSTAGGVRVHAGFILELTKIT